LAVTMVSITGVFCACFRQDIQKYIVSTPQMKNRECAEIIANSVEKFRSVQNVEVDLKDKKVIVTYNSVQLAEKNIETAITKAGFDANNLLADPKSRAELPSELK